MGILEGGVLGLWGASGDGFGHTMTTLLRGYLISLALIVPSATLGVLVGIVAGTGRALGPRLARGFLDAYVALFRGTPVVVQLLILYYGAGRLGATLKPWIQGWEGPDFLWRLFQIPAYMAAILVFSLCSGAYQSEYIRGAILSIKRGQFLAARALGFSDRQTFCWVIVPQALRRALPGCGNEIIYLIKYSSLACIIPLAERELTGQAKALADFNYRYLEIFLLAGLGYLATVTLATWALRALERRYHVPGWAK